MDKSSLKFLVDESSGKKVFSALTNEGYDSKFVSDIMPAEEDVKVLEYAEKEKRIIITNDKDFGELVFRLNKPSSGVILLRLKIDKPENRIKSVLNVISFLSNKLFSSFVVITESGIRVRRLKT